MTFTVKIENSNFIFEVDEDETILDAAAVFAPPAKVMLLAVLLIMVTMKSTAWNKTTQSVKHYFAAPMPALI